MSSFLSWFLKLDADNRHQRRVGLLMGVLFILLIAPISAVLVSMFLRHQMFYEHWLLLFFLMLGILAYCLFIVVMAVVWLIEYKPELANTDDKIAEYVTKKIVSKRRIKNGGL